ncbi:MAG: hypothetical protein EXX96DRAFT_560369 [Benjaminiella poitrasii]|nr:MAG: hypothetical protein EXX96DRAFT_560369 [Benjaminiella poitrasii]
MNNTTAYTERTKKRKSFHSAPSVSISDQNSKLNENIDDNTGQNKDCNSNSSYLNVDEDNIFADLDIKTSNELELQELTSKIDKMSISSTDDEEEWEISTSFSKKQPASESSKEIKRIPVKVEAPGLTTVLECSRFPSSFNDIQLHYIFKEFEGVNGGYKIQRLAENKALALFVDPSTAKQAFISQLRSPIITVRPLSRKTNRALSKEINKDSRSADMHEYSRTKRVVVKKQMVRTIFGIRILKSVKLE